ncbi:MAG: nitroreductase family deazaflavin-dependent oxidoreductase [Acidimicrobiales bacterium]
MQLNGEYEPSPTGWVREQVELYERTGGQEGATLRDTGLPIIIVHTKGRNSGKVRKIPLMKVEHAGEYALVGSMGGAPKNPVWVYNLEADPDNVLIQDGPEPFAVSIRKIDGDERAQWWERAVAAFPPYAEYQERTSRVIPVYIATPADPRHPCVRGNGRTHGAPCCCHPASAAGPAKRRSLEPPAFAHGPAWGRGPMLGRRMGLGPHPGRRSRQQEPLSR